MFIFRKIFKLLKLLRYSLWRKALFHGIAATTEHQNLIKDTNPETIIDIGSNKGQFIMLIEQFFPNKIIHSFEPINEMLEKQKNFFKFKKNIFFHNFALGSEALEREFFITKRMDSSSFFKINTANTKGYNNSSYKINEHRKINIKTLDEVLHNKEIIQPVLIKIDVQGFELEVLKGSEKILKKTNYLLIEVSNYEMYQKQPLKDEIISFLKERDFSIIKQGPPTNTEVNVIQEDILFYKDTDNKN